jgi:hypothetical protein
MAKWLSKIGTWDVERVEIKRKGGAPYFPVVRSRQGVLHTSEGTNVNTLITTLRDKFSPYHLAVAPGRILQFRPLDVQAGSLRKDMNRAAQAQIVMVLSCKETPWLPPPALRDPLVALLRYFKDVEGIPLQEPDTGWPSDYSDMNGQIWANNNIRRRAALKNAWWGQRPGWWQHFEVPNQAPTWHHDCWRLRRKELLDMAAALP